MHQLLGPIEQAGDAVAHTDLVPPHGLQVEHRVEARHLVDGDGWHVEIRRQVVKLLLGQPAPVGVLQDVQRRDHRRLTPLRGILGTPSLDLGADLRREEGVWVHRLRSGCGHGRISEGHQRSISPNTMSMVPMIATTSASMWPRAISSMAARCTKPGARTLSR